MQEIAGATKVGAEAYLRRQYRTIGIIAIIFTVLRERFEDSQAMLQQSYVTR